MPRASVPARSRLEQIVLIAVLVGAMALRARRLGLPTLTPDEWFMLRNYYEGASWIVQQARVFEPHPLLYYLGFWLWVDAAGATEYAMRFPSVLFGVVACVALWRLTREVAGPAAGISAALLLAANPYQIAQSQNARNYAMVAALATAATAALAVANRQRGGAWGRYAGLALLALHTHLNAILTTLGHGLWLVADAAIRRRPPPRAAWLAFATIVALFVPWLIYAAPALSAYQGYFPERVGPLEVARRALATFAYGQYEPPADWRLGLIAALVLAGALTPGAGLVAVAATVPVIGAAALFLIRPMFEERYLIVAAPALIGLAAIGPRLFAGPRVWPVALTTVALVLIGAPFARDYYRAVEASRPDWRALAGWIDDTASPRDVVVISGHGVAEAYGYYRRADAPLVLAADPESATQAVEAIVAGGARGAYFLPYHESTADQAVHAALARVGYADQARWFRGQRAQFFGLPGGSSPAGAPINARWSGAIELRSAAIEPSEVSPGAPFGVRLEWVSSGGAPNLKLSLRLRDAAGRQVAQLDRRPVDESRPFPDMATGRPIRDGHALWVPPEAAPGAYSIWLLLYEPATTQAITPSSAGPSVDVEGDLVRVGSIVVVPHPEVDRRPTRPGG